MAAIITAAPIISAVFTAGALVAVAQMLASRRRLPRPDQPGRSLQPSSRLAAQTGGNIEGIF